MTLLENVGIILTVVMLFVSAMAVAMAGVEDFEGMIAEGSLVEAGLDTIQGLIDSINEDLEVATRSDALSQSLIFIVVLIKAAVLMATYLGTTLIAWTAVLDTLFAWTTNGVIMAFKNALQLLIGMIMVYTIFRFVGTTLKSLPFV